MKKNVIIGIMALFMVLLISDRLYNWIVPNKTEKSDRETKDHNKSNVFLDNENPVEIFKAKDSTTIAKKEVKPTYNMENTLNPATQKYIKENILPELKLASQNVESISKISAVASGEIKNATITLPDNTKIRISKAEKIKFSDKYAEILIEKDSTGKILPAKYKFNTDVYAIKGKEKPVFFWQKEKESDFFKFSNPYIEITNVENYTKLIEPKKNVFQINADAQIQVGFKDPRNTNFSTGISASFNKGGFLSPEIGFGKIWTFEDGSNDTYGRVGLNLNILKIKK